MGDGLKRARSAALVTGGLSKVEFLRGLVRARRKATEAIAATAREGGVFGRGLATEGFNGGYRTALDDVEALLRHGFPADDRRFWTEDEN